MLTEPESPGSAADPRAAAPAGALDLRAHAELPAAVRLRIAADVLQDLAEVGAPILARHPGNHLDLESVRVDGSGRSRVSRQAGVSGVVEILWEILAGRRAPAELPPLRDVVDDAPIDVEELVARAIAGEVASIEELAEAFEVATRDLVGTRGDVLRALGRSTLDPAPTAAAPIEPGAQPAPAPEEAPPLAARVEAPHAAFAADDLDPQIEIDPEDLETTMQFRRPAAVAQAVPPQLTPTLGTRLPVPPSPSGRSHRTPARPGPRGTAPMLDAASVPAAAETPAAPSPPAPRRWVGKATLKGIAERGDGRAARSGARRHEPGVETEITRAPGGAARTARRAPRRAARVVGIAAAFLIASGVVALLAASPGTGSPPPAAGLEERAVAEDAPPRPAARAPEEAAQPNGSAPVRAHGSPGRGAALHPRRASTIPAAGGPPGAPLGAPPRAGPAAAPAPRGPQEGVTAPGY